MLLKAFNLAVAFMLELCMLAALAYWGFQASESVFIKLLLGVGAPVIVAVIWGLLLAPRSERRLTGFSYLLLKFILFGAAAISLVAAGQTTWAVIFAVVSVVNQVLLMLWNQETVPNINS